MIDFGAARSESLWHPEPSQRGTYSVISECVVTLALCVWAAVHLNIPEYGKKAAQTRRKLLWLVAGVFVPELLVWTAWDQNREARALHKEVKLALGQREPAGLHDRIKMWARHVASEIGLKSQEDPEKTVEDGHPAANQLRAHRWTMTHSFFATMGGFVFDADAFRHRSLPGGRKRATLSTLAVGRLAVAAPHLLPDISADIILDKSKSSRLAQAVVGLQALWFFVQCISRMAMGLTASLLELTTLVHCLCILAAYLLWWDKPLDIHEPMFIHGQDADLICAGMFMKSTLGTRYMAEGYIPGQQVIARLWHEDDGDLDPRHPEDGLMEHLAVGIQSVPAGPNYVEVGEPETPSGTADQITTLYMGQSLFGFGFRRCSPAGLHRFTDISSRLLRHIMPTRNISKTVETAGFMGLRRPFIRFESGDVRWFRLAQRCYFEYPDIAFQSQTSTRASGISSQPRSSTTHTWLHEYAVPRSSNWKSRAHSNITSGIAGLAYKNIFNGSSVTTVLALTLVCAVYGGLHLLAWEPPITAESERILWRASGIVVAVWFPVLVFLFLPLALVASSFADDHSSSGPQWNARSVTVRPATLLIGLSWFVWLVLICAWLFSAAARLYLPIQSVVSVPRLPDSTFETPSWSRYFPHIS
ncbi:hypothetical protein B0T14DRAFT_334226 [Immersiella caudata]|uniref:Uncharacterized protein n=1 Tax=Immersiella caudata TaxID=314043 RepID=A0AA39THQ9_9PEZI|nr:hypothetical protein B0T14DRAFT_334226 [Immersiella caudata]